MPWRAAILATLALLALSGAGCGVGFDAPRDSAPAWAPASRAKITPGVQTRTKGGQCTSNFVFYDGKDVYLGQAAHCSSTGGESDTDGCSTGSRPLGTPVAIQGASRPGTLVYNSWLAMRKAGEPDKDTCRFNDLALVRIDPADLDRVNPSVPKFGGPSGLGTAARGEKVFTYGNSELRLGIALLSPKNGVVLSNEDGGWNHVVLTATPGIPGDSGSGFLNRQGQAFGVLSTLDFLGRPGSNGVGDLSRELAYARAHGFAGLQLGVGTEKFRSSLFGII